MRNVITYSSSRGDQIHLTPRQVQLLSVVESWPRDWAGEEYATVSHGRHIGEPSFDSDADLLADVGVDSDVARVLGDISDCRLLDPRKVRKGLRT